MRTVDRIIILLLLTALSAFGQSKEGVGRLPVKEKRWALVIGVDRYDDPEIALGGASRDARTLRDALVSTAGFPADQVILLATGEPADHLPTRSNILRRLSNLVTKSVPHDGLFLMAFSGHGIERNGQVYLYPSDIQSGEDVSLLQETAVSVSWIHDQIQANRIDQVLLLIDSCRNNPGGKGDMPNRLSAAYLPPFSFNTRNQGVRAYATLFATALNHRAYEYAEKRQGYFTWAVVEGLRGAAANERGEVTLSRLVGYVEQTVPKLVAADLGNDQVPFSKIEGYRADDLVLSVVPARSQPSSPPLVVPSLTADANAVELKFWDSAEKLNTVEAYQEYLRRYPSGTWASLARLHVTASNPSMPATSYSLAAAEQAYQSADYGRAREILQKGVAVGDKDAELRLGLLLYHGLGGTADYSEGSWLLQRAAQHGLKEAEGWLGFFWIVRGGGEVGRAVEYATASAARGELAGQVGVAEAFRRGVGKPKDIKESDRLYKLALPALQEKAEHGDPWAETVYGLAFGDGVGVTKDATKAVELFRRAAAKGYPMAQINLAGSYARGEGGLPKDEAKAAELRRLAADRGVPSAQSALAYMYEIGAGGLPKDDKKALELYTSAASHGHHESESNVGWFYEQGRGGLPKDAGKAAEWYIKAADGGEDFALWRLGDFYYYGLGGLAIDAAKAVKFYRAAAEKGRARAQYALGRSYQFGSGGLPIDRGKAVEWYQKSAEQDDPEGQANLGYCYANAYGGLSQDLRKAAALYAKAAAAGVARAQNNLGALYHEGNGGLPKDQTKAAELYRKAADQGLDAAQSNLGVMYELGEGGLTRDASKAVELYKKSAAGGSASGQYNLGRAYEYGIGGLKANKTTAIEWYGKAARQGDELAQKGLARLQP